MEFVFRSRFLHFVVAVRDFDKDEPEEEFVGVDNTGGSFQFADQPECEQDSGSCCEPLDMRIGFRSTQRSCGD